MQLEPFVDSLISQALIGSHAQSFDHSLLPQSIQGAVSNVLEQATDEADKFLQVISIVDGYLCSNETVPLNSISLKDSLTYYSLKTSPDLLKGKAKKGKAAKSSTPSLEPAAIEHLQNLKERVEQFAGPQPLLPWLSPDEIALVAQVNSLHTTVSDDIGLKYVPSSRLLPVFPDEIFQLFEAIQEDNNPVLLYYFLRKLSTCPLRFDTRYVLRLMDLTIEHCEIEQDVDLDLFKPLFSSYMMQELLLKVGGAPLQFLVSHHIDSKNKALLEVIESLHLQDKDLIAQQGYPRLVLTPTESEAAVDLSTELSTLTATESNIDPSEELNLDYAALLKNLTPSQSIEILVKLRWTQPELAREIIGQKLLKVNAKLQTWIQILNLMRINLSLQDEDWLMQLLDDPEQEQLKKPSKSKKVSAAAEPDKGDTLAKREAIARLLTIIQSPKYSKLCLEICSKYLQFCGPEQEGQYWQLQLGNKHLKYGPEFAALGFVPEFDDMTQNEFVGWLLSCLLDALTWEDMCILAKADNPQQVFQNWALFEKSTLSPEDDEALKADSFMVQRILCHKIAGTQAPELAKEFLQALDTIFAANDYQYYLNLAVTEKLLMHLPVEQRCEWVKSHPSCAPDCSWLAEVGNNPCDFSELSSAWGTAVVHHLVEFVEADTVSRRLNTFRMMLPCFFADAVSIDWCEQKVQAMQQKFDEKLFASMRSGKSAQDQRHDSYEINKQAQKAGFVKNLSKSLKLKLAIDQAILSLQKQQKK